MGLVRGGKGEGGLDASAASHGLVRGARRGSEGGREGSGGLSLMSVCRASGGEEKVSCRCWVLLTKQGCCAHECMCECV